MSNFGDALEICNGNKAGMVMRSLSTENKAGNALVKSY